MPYDAGSWKTRTEDTSNLRDEADFCLVEMG